MEFFLGAVAPSTMAPVASPFLRTVLERVAAGQQHLGRLGSKETTFKLVSEFNTLQEVQRSALVPEDLAALDGAVNGALRLMYVACPYDVFLSAWRAAERPQWGREVWKHLDCARRASGLTPPWWRLLRRLSHRRSVLRAADQHGHTCRPRHNWAHFWCDFTYLPATSTLNVLTAPISLPIAVAVRVIAIWRCNSSEKEGVLRIPGGVSSAPKRRTRFAVDGDRYSCRVGAMRRRCMLLSAEPAPRSAEHTSAASRLLVRPTAWKDEDEYAHMRHMGIVSDIEPQAWSKTETKS